MTNVKQYTDKQLLDRVNAIGGCIPNVGKYMIIGVQSNEDAFNIFDDKFYVFDGPEFKQVSTGTTNAGRMALLHFDQFNLPGAAVWKTDMYYKDLYKNGLHRGRMKALRQQKPIFFYRDNNKNNFVEEFGELHHDIIWANMHGVSYNPYSNIVLKDINKWSFACPVWNRMSDYKEMIKAIWKRNKPVDYAILKEF
jgi:hypothetical protein